MPFQCLSSSGDDSPWLVGMNSHFIFNSCYIWFDILSFSLSYRSKVVIQRWFHWYLSWLEKIQSAYSWQILKEWSTSNFSHGTSMARIKFSPGLKPAELEQVAELMCYALESRTPVSFLWYVHCQIFTDFLKSGHNIPTSFSQTDL